MLRGMPPRIRSTSFSRMSWFKLSKTASNGSVGMNSRGVAMIFISSLTATPMRLLPWSSARIRILQIFHGGRSGGDGFVHVLRGVGRREEARFELGGGLVNSLI